jgi:DnaJ-class molecular chaperone
MTDQKRCPRCGGAGVVPAAWVSARTEVETCPVCSGTGSVSEPSTCPMCGGAGTVSISNSLSDTSGTEEE